MTKFDKAIEDYNKAIEHNSKYVQFYINLAEVYAILNHKDSLIIAQKSLELSRNIEETIISKFLIDLNLFIQVKGEKEEKDFIEYCNVHKGYELPFYFDTLKDAFKNSKYSGKINNLIKLIKKNASS